MTRRSGHVFALIALMRLSGGRLESGAHEASRRTAPNRPCPAPQVVRRTWALRRDSRDYRDPGCGRRCGRARCGASSPSRLFVIVTIAMAKRPTKQERSRASIPGTLYHIKVRLRSWWDRLRAPWTSDRLSSFSCIRSSPGSLVTNPATSPRPSREKPISVAPEPIAGETRTHPPAEAVSAGGGEGAPQGTGTPAHDRGATEGLIATPVASGDRHGSPLSRIRNLSPRA